MKKALKISIKHWKDIIKKLKENIGEEYTHRDDECIVLNKWNMTLFKYGTRACKCCMTADSCEDCSVNKYSNGCRNDGFFNPPWYEFYIYMNSHEKITKEHVLFAEQVHKNLQCVLIKVEEKEIENERL